MCVQAKIQISLRIHNPIGVFAHRLKKPVVIGYPQNAERRQISVRTPRLIFDGHTSHFVGFTVHQLVFKVKSIMNFEQINFEL